MSFGVPDADLPRGVRLRPVTASDMPMLEQVYASTRIDELAQTDWSDEQKAAFIAFQFRAQHQHYTEHYHDAQFLVVLVDDAPAGRVYLHWRARELRIVDITLLPHARGRGTGGALLRALIAEATRRRCGVSIHVERFNPAMRLYLRLGFRKAGEHGVYDLMERPHDAA